MFIPKGFELYELFPEYFYNKHRMHPAKMWQMFDDRILVTIHNLRKRYGTMVVNDYRWGGKNHYRGWRPENCIYGAELSQHKRAGAVDSKPVKTTAEKIRQDILADPFHPDFIFITCMEMGTSWLHVDTRNWDKAKIGILLIYPKGEKR